MSGASGVTLLYTSATSFDGSDRIPGHSGIDPAAVCRRVMREAEGQSFDALLEAHVRDYQALFKRVDLQLGSPQRADVPRSLPTDERLRRIMNGAEDPDMLSLVFQYGRYLLISSSGPERRRPTCRGYGTTRCSRPGTATTISTSTCR